MGELAEPGVLDRLRARFGWLDHVVRAFTRFNDRNGSLWMSLGQRLRCGSLDLAPQCTHALVPSQTASAL